MSGKYVGRNNQHEGEKRCMQYLRENQRREVSIEG